MNEAEILSFNRTLKTNISSCMIVIVAHLACVVSYPVLESQDAGVHEYFFLHFLLEYTRVSQLVTCSSCTMLYHFELCSTWQNSAIVLSSCFHNRNSHKPARPVLYCLLTCSLLHPHLSLDIFIV